MMTQESTATILLPSKENPIFQLNDVPEFDGNIEHELNKALIPKHPNDSEYQVVVAKGKNGRYYIKTVNDQRFYKLPKSGNININYPSDKKLQLVKYNPEDFDFEFEEKTLQTLFKIRKDLNSSGINEVLKLEITEEEKQRIITEFETHKDKILLGLYNQLHLNLNTTIIGKINHINYVIIPIFIGNRTNMANHFIIYNLSRGQNFLSKEGNCITINNDNTNIYKISSVMAYIFPQYILKLNLITKQYKGHENIGKEQFSTLQEAKFIYDSTNIAEIDCNTNPERIWMNAMGAESGRFHLQPKITGGASRLSKNHTRKYSMKPKSKHQPRKKTLRLKTKK